MPPALPIRAAISPYRQFSLLLIAGFAEDPFLSGCRVLSFPQVHLAYASQSALPSGWFEEFDNVFLGDRPFPASAFSSLPLMDPLIHSISSWTIIVPLNIFLSH